MANSANVPGDEGTTRSETVLEKIDIFAPDHY